MGIEMLGVPQRRATQGALQATERKAQFQKELDAISGGSAPSNARAPTPAEDDPVALEREVRRLEERQREIRGELDGLSRKLEAQQETLRTHMTQEQQRRSALAEARNTATRHQSQVLQEEGHMECQQAECAAFFKAMQQAQEGVLSALADAERASQAELDATVLATSTCHSSMFTDADSHLDASVTNAQKFLAESQRAQQTLDLLGVAVQEGELPHLKELPTVLRSLQLAWHERQALGECPRGQEVEELLRKVAAEDPTGAAAGGMDHPAEHSAGRGTARQESMPNGKKASSASGSTDMKVAAAEPGSRRAPPRICVDALDAPSPLVSPSGTRPDNILSLDPSTPLVSPSGSGTM